MRRVGVRDFKEKFGCSCCLVPLAIYFCTSHGPAGHTFHKHKATPPSDRSKKII